VKVALDAQMTIGTATGIGEYVRGLSRALPGVGVEVVELLEPRVDPWRFDRRVYWDQVLLPKRARASGADILHCTSGTMPLWLGLPTVVTVHDVAWLRVQAHTPSYARYYFGRFSIARYRRASRVVVDSKFSRGELHELGNVPESSMDVVYPGVDATFGGIDRRGDGRTILAVGTIEPRKNLEAIVRALPLLSDARLVAVGPHTPYVDTCAALAERLGVRHRVEMPGYVTQGELLELYATAAVAAVPSEYEGFGYAAAQALCAGLPVAVSDRSSLPEVVAGDAPVIELGDDAAWAAFLGDGLSGRLDERARAVRAACVQRFAWSASANRMRAIYEDVLRLR
jgi:glycosyltransferase involved in cell wall biosynthesis